MWVVLFAAEFDAWFETLTAGEQDALLVSLSILRDVGPTLARPHVDSVKGSKHSNMKELRTQYRGQPLRTFFAFDPARAAIILIGGNKRGDKRFYNKMIPVADAIFDRHLRNE